MSSHREGSPEDDSAQETQRDTKGEDEAFFMSIALLSSERSKDPVTQVGACIVSHGRVVATGYNGLPDGCSDDDLPWTKGDCKPDSEMKRLYVCHAEMNALLNRGVQSLSDAIVYCTHSPCWDCAREMSAVGIKEVKYLYPFKDVIDALGSTRLKCIPYVCSESQYKGKTIKILLRERKLILSEDDDNHWTQQREGGRKRPVHLKWEDYFMAMAYLAAMRGYRKSPEKLHYGNGAYIINDRKKFVGIGYDQRILNLSPPRPGDPDSVHYGVCHAVTKAILECNSPDLRGCTLYTLYFPCNKCALVIIQSGIRKVVYMYDADRSKPTPDEADRHPMAPEECSSTSDADDKHPMASEECSSTSDADDEHPIASEECSSTSDADDEHPMASEECSSTSDADDKLVICPCAKGYHTADVSKKDELVEKTRASRKLLDHAGVFYKKYDCGLPDDEDLERYKVKGMQLSKPIKKSTVQIRLSKSGSDPSEKLVQMDLSGGIKLFEIYQLHTN